MTQRRLLARLRLDIALGDLLFALVACAGARRRSREAAMLEACGGAGETIACLSLRSAFDLLLTALEPEPGGEVAFSAVTHPDMARIALAHGLQPVPVDVDLETLAPRPDALDAALGERTRLLVVAHLFGGRVDLGEPLARARALGIPLVEDCAQSLRGPQDRGDPQADVSLFSFGSIKTATALGGGLARVRDPALYERMRALQETWPVQSRREYAARVVRTVGLVVVARPRLYALFARALARSGRDLDAVVGGSVRGFPGPDLLARIRRRPSAPLLALLARRLRRFDPARIEQRSRAGERVAAALPATLPQPGRAAPERTHWVFPVLAGDPPALVERLRDAGFDAARATSGITAVAAPDGRPELAPGSADELMAGVVFLPVYPELRERDVEALIAVVQAP